jgi:hypothetical protein
MKSVNGQWGQTFQIFKGSGYMVQKHVAFAPE